MNSKNEGATVTGRTAVGRRAILKGAALIGGTAGAGMLPNSELTQALGAPARDGSAPSSGNSASTSSTATITDPTCVWRAFAG